MDLYLCTMTKELARRYYSQFVMDPDLFMDMSQFKPYVYSEAQSDARVDRYREMERIFLAVMLDLEPIGEIVLKNISKTQKHCTLGITMRSDEFKNKGYGTIAEQLTLQYAFNELGMETVFADSILKNTRSQHVLIKAGFREIRRDDSFVYYRCDKTSWLNAFVAEPIPGPINRHPSLIL